MLLLFGIVDPYSPSSDIISSFITNSDTERDFGPDIDLLDESGKQTIRWEIWKKATFCHIQHLAGA